MSIIIISSDSKEKEIEIAEQCVESLGYQLLNREVLKDVAQKYDIRKVSLVDVLEKKPSYLRKMPPKKWYYCLACIEAEVLERLLADNIVCCGLAAHLYVNGVSHALKARVLSGNEQQVEKIAEERGVSVKRGQKWLISELRRRERWSMAAFERNETDPSLYDLVVNLANIAPEDAVKTVSEAVSYRKFQPMTYSVNCLNNFALSAKIRAILLKSYVYIDVFVRDGAAKITTKALNREKQRKAEAIRRIVGEVEGVTSVEVNIIKDIFGEAIQSYR